MQKSKLQVINQNFIFYRLVRFFMVIMKRYELNGLAHSNKQTILLEVYCEKSNLY